MNSIAEGLISKLEQILTTLTMQVALIGQVNHHPSSALALIPVHKNARLQVGYRSRMSTKELLCRKR